MHALASWLTTTSIIPAQYASLLLVFWHPAGGVPELNGWSFLSLFNVNCTVKLNFRFTMPRLGYGCRLSKVTVYSML